ncbi:MAG TPA: hypothetical protein VJT75_03965 [Thermoleophilaceae bacterium]|nr:hypothetical protein [Thermoleophilaceae bacterium]
MRAPAFRLLVAALALLLVGAAPAAAARKVPRGFFGVNASGNIELASDSTQRQMWDKLAAGGAESARVLFNWSISEPSPGQFDWSRNDSIVEYAVEHGMKILPVVEYAPAWARKYPDVASSPPSSPEPYTDFLRAAIQRYGPHGTFWLLHPTLPQRPIRQWQIWNEPEIVFHWYREPFNGRWRPRDARPYVDLLKAAYKTVHDADSGANVVLAALSIDSWRSLDKLYRWGKMKKHFDVAALQAFAGDPDFIPTLLHRFRDVLDRHGRKDVPLYVTEMTWPAAKGKANPGYTTGYMSGFLTSRKGAAERLSKAYSILTKRKLRKTMKLKGAYWFIASSSYKSANEFEYSGLLKLSGENLSPVPAYSAYRKAARAAEGCSKASNGNCR